MPPTIKMTGKRIGRLVVVKRSEMKSKNGEICWVCLCDCGNISIIKGSALRGRGKITKSCGCLSREKKGRLCKKCNKKFYHYKRQSKICSKCRNTYCQICGIELHGRADQQWCSTCKPVAANNRAKVWQKENKEKKHIYDIAYREKTRGRRNECARNFIKRHPKRVFATMVHRRLAKKQRTPAWADRKAIRIFYEGCPKGFHVDHIIPLQGEIVSGLHVENNLQYLTAAENIKKSNCYSLVHEGVR